MGLSSPEDVERELVSMIQTGSIHATISQQVCSLFCYLLMIIVEIDELICYLLNIFMLLFVKDGMVKFDSNPETYSSPDMLQLLEGGVLAAITLDRQVQWTMN